MKYKYLILGAGPAGLSFANKLAQSGENSFLVLEKEEVAGGLCRSEIVDGKPLDIGGGHFLDVRRPEVLDFLFQFMPKEEWNLFDRDSRIFFKENYIHHPFEANIWEMDISDQVQFLKSVAIAGCNIGTQMPNKFVDWIYWKLGDLIAEEYMIPYNKKVFSEDLNALGTYWLEKLPNVSFEDTLLSCLEKKAHGKQPGHAQFYYPKEYGYGELWLRMAEKISDKIKYNVCVKSIDFDKRIVNEVYEADCIVNTIPWTVFSEMKGLPDRLKENINKLKYNSIQIDYFRESSHSDAHWIYYPNLELSYHRKLVRHNFCPDSSGYWTETNITRVKPNSSEFKYLNEYAYPLNTIDKPFVMSDLLEWAKTRKVYGLGRWGEWNHYNSDVTVELSMRLANNLLSI